jgi:hypothetical protein
MAATLSIRSGRAARALRWGSRSITKPAANTTPLRRRPTPRGLVDAPLPAVPGKRLPYVESAFEYGVRVGAWRLLRIMRERGVKCSFLAVVQAIEFNPEIAIAAVEAGHADSAQESG